MMSDHASESRQHLFFSPHFDDVVLSCGGLIANLISACEKVKVVTVFAGRMSGERPSAFARHLHAKWGVMDSEAVSVRQAEDLAACQILGVDCEFWEFPEAIYRCDSRGEARYHSYESLTKPDFSEVTLEIGLTERLYELLDVYRDQPVRLYFPLGLAKHIDHQLLADIGRDLAVSFTTWFYEEWPYVESLEPPENSPQGWEKFCLSIELSAKIQAAACYLTQLKGLGGDSAALKERLLAFSSRFCNDGPCECYWELQFYQQAVQWPVFSTRKKTWRLGDFNRFLVTLNDFTSVKDIIPPGKGDLLDVGCGSGRYKKVVELQGFTWRGFDVIRLVEEDHSGCDFLADGTQIPLPSGTMSAVLAWCVLAYLKEPRKAIGEIGRVLEPGGLVVGMASFLEPVHGQTYTGPSPLAIRHWLESEGFEDIVITPGLNGFTLMLWTWLRRFGNDRLARLAFPLTKLWLVPLAGIRFLISWLKWRFADGAGFGMHWVTEKMPLSFAGHLVFTARKGHEILAERS